MGQPEQHGSAAGGRLAVADKRMMTHRVAQRHRFPATSNKSKRWNSGQVRRVTRPIRREMKRRAAVKKSILAEQQIASTQGLRSYLLLVKCNLVYPIGGVGELGARLS